LQADEDRRKRISRLRCIQRGEEVSDEEDEASAAASVNPADEAYLVNESAESSVEGVFVGSTLRTPSHPFKVYEADTRSIASDTRSVPSRTGTVVPLSSTSQAIAAAAARKTSEAGSRDRTAEVILSDNCLNCQ
jgi:hypothetical protein